MSESDNSTQSTQIEGPPDAVEYLINNRAGYTDGLFGDYTFEEIEVPDSVAGRMRDDPRITIERVEKGEFGLDQGTMIISFTFNNIEKSS